MAWKELEVERAVALVVPKPPTQWFLELRMAREQLEVSREAEWAGPPREPANQRPNAGVRRTSRRIVTLRRSERRNLRRTERIQRP